MSLRDINFKAQLPYQTEVEVAVVGAGISGLYTAYRLTHDENNPIPGNQVQVFEQSSRIGGRLESVYLPGMEIAGELGGMRYMTSQKIVTTLIEHVFQNELINIPFPMGDGSNHFGYLRGQRMKMNAWQKAQAHHETFETRYFLDTQDKGFSANQLFNKVVFDVLSADPWFVKHYGNKISNPEPFKYKFKLTREEWNDIKPNITYWFDGPYYGEKVNDLGFWNLIKDQVSEEGYNFLANAGGYYSNTINWNAAEAFPYMVGDFSKENVTYKTIQGGYDLIAYALANAYVKNKGGNIWVNNRLETFVKQPEGKYKYQLRFFNEESGAFSYVYANRIVLAMPKRSLELLDQNNFFFDEERNEVLRKNMASVINEPSYKILMGFEHPWWKDDLGIYAGHSITDLPVRQCYYFGTNPDNSHSMLLGSYNDMRTTSFWEPLAKDTNLFQPKSTHKVSEKDLEHLKNVQASQLMVQEVINELKEIHGMRSLPEPYVTWYKDWSLDPYGGGYHAWKARYNVKKVMAYMRKPQASEDIHICGEAYSDRQGWVEGALCVAEHMLEEHFGLQRPSWLHDSYYLGW